MERKRGVCPIVPNQSFDDEAFISARASEPRQSKIPATIPELTIEMTIAMLPRMAALHPDASMRRTPGFDRHDHRKLTLIGAVTRPSRKVYWGPKRVRTIYPAFTGIPDSGDISRSTNNCHEY
jgi:hypothetical protein